MTFRGWSLLILLPMLGIYFSGQAQAIQKGDGMVSFGASFGSLTQNFSQGLPGVNVTAEYGLKDNFGPGALGIGLFLGFKNELYNRVDGPFTYRGTLKNQMLALRFQWYPYILASEKFECYVTFAPGIKREYRVGEFFGIDQDEDVLLITHGATIGGRFFIRDRFGLYLEMGYGLHNLAVGLVFGGKLKRHVVDTR